MALCGRILVMCVCAIALVCHAQLTHKAQADSIIDILTNGALKGLAYNRTAQFVDKFGHRLAGSANLEIAIDWLVSQLEAEGFENVHTEPVDVPHWVRGHEECMLLEPRPMELPVLGLGYSEGTPLEGVVAPAIVVSSFEELARRAADCAGAIVVFNQPWRGYGKSVEYRVRAASAAAQAGAVAVLVRSVTPFSISSPHTGMMTYDKNDRKRIPAACITVEHAEMLARLQNRGQKIVIRLKMEAKMLEPVTSRNVVAELRGSQHPEQVVLVSGHIDSWDVGQGAMDDAGGSFISWAVLSTLLKLRLRPKRTVRLVLFTAEEIGGLGGAAYFKKHFADIARMDLVMESDLGVFLPFGIEATASEAAVAVLTSVAQHLAPINASAVVGGGGGEDIDTWAAHGVPAVSLANANSEYFYFHHTAGDTMNVLNSTQVDLCTAVWAVTAFVVADLPAMLPRGAPL